MDINIFLIFKIYLSFKIIFEAGITIDFSIKTIDASNMIQLKKYLLGAFLVGIVGLFPSLHHKLV